AAGAHAGRRRRVAAAGLRDHLGRRVRESGAGDGPAEAGHPSVAPLDVHPAVPCLRVDVGLRPDPVERAARAHRRRARPGGGAHAAVGERGRRLHRPPGPGGPERRPGGRVDQDAGGARREFLRGGRGGNARPAEGRPDDRSPGVARAVLLIYLGTAVIAVGLLVTALATDLTYQQELARETLLLETQVHAYYLGRHLHLLAGELARLGLRSEVNLLDRNSEPERSLLRLTHEKSAFFNVGVAVIGPDGAAIWAEPQSFLPAGMSLAAEPWFQAVLRTRSVLIAPVQPERERDSVLYMVSPILRAGEFQGVLLGAIDLAPEGALGTEFHPGLHGLNVLATRAGLVIYPPKPPSFSSGADWRSIVGGHPDEP